MITIYDILFVAVFTLFYDVSLVVYCTDKNILFLVWQLQNGSFGRTSDIYSDS